MTCKDCTDAAMGPHHGFTAACRGCCARAAARSPHFARVLKLGRLDRQYQTLLYTFALTHDEVKAAAQVDVLGRASIAKVMP